MKKILSVVVGILSGTVLAQEHPGRLVVGDAKAGLIQVIDLEKGQAVGSFSSPGPSNIYSAPGGQYAMAIHREQNRVSVVYGGLGLEDHGDHKHLVLANPYIWSTLTTGPKPTHFTANGDTIAIFNDGDGSIALIDAQKLGLRPEVTEIATGAADHGAPMPMGEFVLSGSLNKGTVEVFRGGKKQEDLAGCPQLHGQAVLGNVVAYGCDDGVLLIEKGATFTARKLSEPAGMAQARVGTVISHAKHPFFIGNFGKGLVRIDNALTLYPLPEAPVRFTFDASGGLVVLTADGTLHTLEATTGKVLKSLKVTEAAPTGEGAVRPALVVANTKAYVTRPASGELVEIDLATMSVERTFKVEGTPGSVTWLWVAGKRH
jgi:DNA-binding beta-propeller fold protein YncE